jgi:tetratricopeptide (TPR) repeat protein
MPTSRQNPSVRWKFPLARYGWVASCWVLALACLAGGCKRKEQDAASSPFSAAQNKSRRTDYFKTPFQDESQYIVEAIVSDLAEMVYFAQNKRLPEPKLFSVDAQEKPGSHPGFPAYAITITLDEKAPLQAEVDLSGPIWSAAMYEGLTSALARQVGLGPSQPGLKGNTTLLQKLTDAKAETLEQENETLSTNLQGDFSNPVLHEEAAVLLGAFALRENAGKFTDLRAPLCRATAHLALAHFLNNGHPTGLNGRMAECMLLTLMENQAAALEKLGAMEQSDGPLTNWVRALQAFNTCDYRPLLAVKQPVPIENIALFQAYQCSVNVDLAWTKIGRLAATLPDFARLAQEAWFSVGVGNYMLEAAVPLETNEIKSVYKLSQGGELADKDLVAALNRPPGRCFTLEEGHPLKVRVIGWGLWALALQHHLCQALTTDFDVLAYHQGLPDEAKQFSELADKTYDGLRLYPFVRRFNATEIGPYHKAVDDAFKVTVETPHLTPAMCWNYACFKVRFAPEYRPIPNPHINEWHKHNPPPGTAYDVGARIYHSTFTGDARRVTEVHAMAPYNLDLCRYIVDQQLNKTPTFEQAKSLYELLLPYSVPAMRAVAATLQAEPQRYEEMMEKAAALDPTAYHELGDFAWSRNETNKAITYYDKAAEKNPDTVAESWHARRRIYYYLHTGQTNKARTIAESAAETYSSAGLSAKGDFLEGTGQLEAALEWYAKVEERYNESDEIWGFCSRHSQKTGHAAFDQAVQKRLQAWGKILQKVSLRDFTSPPAEGAVLADNSDLLNSAGLKKGDVIVAVGGMRVRNAWQYTTARDLDPNPMLTIIVWQNGQYREIKASPPGHKFGAMVDNYKPK